MSTLEEDKLYSSRVLFGGHMDYYNHVYYKSNENLFKTIKESCFGVKFEISSNLISLLEYDYNPNFHKVCYKIEISNRTI